MNKWARFACAACLMFAGSAATGQTIYLEDFSTDGDGSRYTLFGRGSDTSPDAWDTTFSLAQSTTFPLGPGGEITLDAPRVAIPWQSSIDNALPAAVPFLDSAVAFANSNANLNVSFLVNDGPSVGSLAPGDSAVFDRLGELGHTVNLFDATSITQDSLATTDLLMVSDSVNVGNIYKSINIRNVDVPVVNYSTSLADDLLLTTSGGSIRDLTSIDIQMPNSPALPPGYAAGDTVALVDGSAAMPEYGSARAGVQVLATYQGPFARSIQGLETVDAMTDGRAGSFTGTAIIEDADLNDNSAGIWSFDNPIPLPESPDFEGEPGDLNQYAVVSRGTITVNTAGDYVFGVGGDDGGRLRINGDDVIVDDSFHGFQYETAQVTLPAGDHEIEWVGFEGGGGSGFELSWVKAEDFFGDPNADFLDFGDPVSTLPGNDDIELKAPGLETTAHFLAPELGPDVATNNPAVMVAPAGTTFNLPSEPFENAAGDYLLGTDMDSIPGNDLNGGILQIPAEGEAPISLAGVADPKLSIDVAASFSVEPDDSVVILVNGNEIARLAGNDIGILQDEASGQLIDSNFRTLTYDLPSGISEIESIEIEVGSFGSSGEAVGIDQVRITDGDPTDAKTVVISENRIQQGVNGYDGLEDTEIRFSEPDADLSEKMFLNPDGADGGGEVQGLTKFNDIIGDGPNQIPADANIESATLNINIVGPGTPLALHRMLAEWEDDTATWNAFVGGIQADDVEAVSVADDVQTANTGITTWDITETIKAWQEDPDSNYGWVMLPLGTNGVDYLSAEALALDTGDLNVAPYIDFVLSTMDPCPLGELGDINCDGTIDFNDFLTLSGNFGQTVDPGTMGDLDGDGEVQFNDFLTLSGNFGTSAAAASVPEPSGLGLALFAVVGLLLRRRRR